MTPLPGSLGSGELFGWRIDQERFASSWDSGEGAFKVGGRWNAPGSRAVYCAIDPATAILEVAVHTTFRVLDTVPHVLTALRLTNAAKVHLVQPEDIPNPNWLRPGIPSSGQQNFGSELLEKHSFVLIPSAVSRHSWNLLFDPDMTEEGYCLESQERLTLDPRLHVGAS